ncbi:MAG: hypothetical protein HZB65_01640 [Candidatus Aenigmarchaeota archaeon]|nr:hypothetical protein [Candidatus Aenigmarchaeota archaeon]
MEQQTVLVIILVAVLLVVVVQAFQITSLGNKVTGQVTSGSSSGSMDMTGWTENEKMNYEMHGTIPSRVSGGSASISGSGMVGGC